MLVPWRQVPLHQPQPARGVHDSHVAAPAHEFVTLASGELVLASAEGHAMRHSRSASELGLSQRKRTPGHTNALEPQAASLLQRLS